jgi:hypothetical protein
MLALVGITLTLIFILLWRTGVLDDLPEILGRRSPPEDAPEQIEDSTYDPDKDRRLDIFKDYFESETGEDEQ